MTYRDGELDIDLGPHFADADGDALTFTVAVADTTIASASVSLVLTSCSQVMS